MQRETYQNGWEESYAQHGPDHLWETEPVPFMARIIDALHSYRIRSVLDIGCGEGRNLRALANAGFTSAGVDVAPSGLDKARELVKAGHFLFQCDAVDLPLVSGAVDAVTCLDVIGHVDSPADVISEIRRILTADGLLVLNAFTLDDVGYGEGKRIGKHTFRYRNTVYRFYEEPDLRALFFDWRIHFLERVDWHDPPHGDFRPYPHRHDCWLLCASPDG